MKSIISKTVLIGFILFLLIQLYQPSRNIDNGQILPQHITKVYKVPDNVQTILQTSCFDCHSNNTNYPWYSYIQPARFFMEEHIEEGKENLNFSEFGKYSKRKQENKLKAIVKQIKSNEMPLSSYTLIHRNAVLTTTQKEEVIDWFNKTEDSLSSKY
nr:heme-binding domain-containing protein [uncultured Flavobacterium sp.]